MGFVRLDQDGNLTGNAVAGNRPGDEAARQARRGEYIYQNTSVKLPVTVTTDGNHASIRIGQGTETHYESGKEVPKPSAAVSVTGSQAIGGQYAAQEIRARADLKKILPPEQLAALKKMAQEGHGFLIDSVAPVSAPRAPVGRTR